MFIMLFAVYVPVILVYIYSSHLSPEFQIRVFKYISSLMSQGNLKFDQYDKIELIMLQNWILLSLFFYFSKWHHIYLVAKDKGLFLLKILIHPLLNSVCIIS